MDDKVNELRALIKDLHYLPELKAKVNVQALIDIYNSLVIQPLGTSLDEEKQEEQIK